MSRSRGSKANPNFQLVNKLSWISPREVLQSWLINTVYHLLVKNNKGEGRGRLINFLPLKTGGLLRRWGLFEKARGKGGWGGGGGGGKGLIEDPSSTDKKSVFQYLESGIHSVGFKIRDCLGSPYMLRKEGDCLQFHSKSDRKSEPGIFTRMQSILMFRVGHSRNSGKFFLFNPKSWALESVIPASYPGQFALSELTRGGLEPSAIGEFSRQAWQVTSNPKSPRTTGNEAAVIRIPLMIGIRTPSSTGKESEIQYLESRIQDRLGLPYTR